MSTRIRKFLRIAAVFAVVALAGQDLASAFMKEPPPAVTVNDVGIPALRIEAEQRWIFAQKSLFHPPSEGLAVSARREAFDRVIVWELVRQKLAAAGQLATEAEIDEYTAKERAKVGGIFESYLAILGQNEISFRVRSFNVLNFKRYQRDYIEAGIVVTEAEVRERYNQAESGARPAQSFEAARDGIESQLRAGKIAKALREHTAGLKQAAQIKVLAPEYSQFWAEWH